MIAPKVLAAAAVFASLTTAAPKGQLDARENALLDGAKSGMVNHQQVVDTLTHQLKTQSGHANAERMSAAITGLDSQIDNAIGTAAHALAPFTGGLSMAVGNFLLGPFVQAVTNGAEVALSNMVGGAADMVQNAATASFVNSMSRLSTQAARVGVNTSRLDRVTGRFRTMMVTSSSASKRDVEIRENALLDGAKSGMVNHQQVVDTLTHQLKTQSGHANAERMSAAITGLDSQIDNAIGTAAHALAPFTGGLSMAVGNFLLGPFVQAVTNGAEVALSNMVGGAADMVQNAATASFVNNMSRLSSQAARVGVNTSRLDRVTGRFRTMMVASSSASKRDIELRENPLIDGAKSGMVNHQQVVDTLTHQLKAQSGHANAERMSAAITGLDSQIDNAIGTAAHALAPFTGGLSMAVGNFLLGPFVQAVTNGAEVALSNMVGGAADMVQNAATASFVHSMSRLSNQAARVGVNTSRLDKVTSRYRSMMASH